VPLDFITAVVVIPRLLSVGVVIMVSDIAHVKVLLLHEHVHLDAPVKNISQPAKDTLIMPVNNNDFVTDAIKINK